MINAAVSTPSGVLVVTLFILVSELRIADGAIGEKHREEEEHCCS
jgi:hypothetical protein